MISSGRQEYAPRCTSSLNASHWLKSLQELSDLLQRLACLTCRRPARQTDLLLRGRFAIKKPERIDYSRKQLSERKGGGGRKRQREVFVFRGSLSRWRDIGSSPGGPSREVARTRHTDPVALVVSELLMSPPISHTICGYIYFSYHIE